MASAPSLDELRNIWTPQEKRGTIREQQDTETCYSVCMFLKKSALGELHSVFVFSMLVQIGFRAELSTALCARELSRCGCTYAGCLHHCA